MGTEPINKLQAHREAQGLSYRKIADDTGIPHSTVERIHKGLSVPNRQYARALFHYYDRQVDLVDIYDPLYALEIGQPA